MIIAASIGIVAGLLSGLVPAAGALTTVLILVPILTTFSVTELLLFYMVMTATMQFATLLPSILCLVPGHPSSVYTVAESESINNTEKFLIVRETTISSWVAVISVFLLIYGANHIIVDSLPALFRSSLIFLLLSATVIATVFFSKNRIVTSTMLVALGVLMSMTGFNFFFETNITFGFSFLIGGIDPVILTIVVFGISSIVAHHHHHGTQKIPKTQKPTSTPVSSFLNSTLATLTGFFGGLVPGLTTVASASIYYYIGRAMKFAPKRLITGIETSNSVGAVSQILPLVYFGIPILASEAVLLSLMNSAGFSMLTFDVSEFFKSIVVYFVAASFVGMICCLLIARVINADAIYKLKQLSLALLVISLLIYLFSGDVEIKILQLLLILPLALVLLKFDNIPLIVGFFVGPMLLESGSRIFI